MKTPKGATMKTIRRQIFIAAVKAGEIREWVPPGG